MTNCARALIVSLTKLTADMKGGMTDEKAREKIRRG
jgi:hypothetical protein